MISLATSPPDAKNFKKKALLVIKARKEQNEDEFDPNDPFPTGIENEVVFMEITSKILGNLYSSCQVSAPSQSFLRPEITVASQLDWTLSFWPNPFSLISDNLNLWLKSTFWRLSLGLSNLIKLSNFSKKGLIKGKI